MIERVNEIKFLGVFIDHKLQWQKYTQYVKLKVAKNVGILCKGKKIFKRTTLLTIYNSFIQPYISYCLELWGLCAKKYTDSIYKLQKLCCRIIAGVPNRTPSAPLFKSLGILTLSDMYNQSVLMFMFRFYKGMLPSVIESIFSRKTNTGTVCTREVCYINIPLCKSKVSFNSIKYQGPSIWNKYCAKIDKNCYVYTFSRRVRFTLCDQL